MFQPLPLLNLQYFGKGGTEDKGAGYLIANLNKYLLVVVST